MNVAVFGGSFNPPHLAHVLATTVVLTTHPVDLVLVVPTFQHPFAKSLAPFEDRVTMCELALGWLPRVAVSRVEETLGGESRTLRTLEFLHQEHPDWNLRLVMGADLLLEAPRWHGFDDIARLAPPLILGRVGVEVAGVGAPVLPAVSSTEVRAWVASGDRAKLMELVPRDVLSFVDSRGLYVSS